MKTSTAILIGIGVIATGGIGYFLWRKMSDSGVPVIAGPSQIGSPVNSALLQQPSQLYPVSGPSPARQDDVSQPWSATPIMKDASSGLAVSNIAQNAQLAAGAASITTSIKSIWDTLDVSSWWSDTEASVTEENSFENQNFSWSSYLGSW